MSTEAKITYGPDGVKVEFVDPGWPQAELPLKIPGNLVRPVLSLMRDYMVGLTDDMRAGKLVPLFEHEQAALEWMDEQARRYRI